MNWNERQLLAWRPRRASSRLRRRLFEADQAPPSAKWLWGGLVPATACVLLTLSMFSHTDDRLGETAGFRPAFTNPSPVDGVPDAGRSAQNHVAGVTFESTNHSLFNSNMRFAPAKHLKQQPK